MKKEKNYEQLLLEWKWQQLMLRKKYRDTVAGFSDMEEQRRAFQTWKDEVRDYRESMEYRILSEYQPQDEIFVGRKEYLVRIEEAFLKGSDPVILYGISGIGKSAIARAFVRRNQDRYDQCLLLFYNAGVQEMVCDDYNLSISNLQYSKEQYGSKNRYFQEKCDVLIRIAKKKRILIVIDDMNAVFDKDMERLYSIPADILVTTRMNPLLWGERGFRIEIKELSAKEEWNGFTESYQTRVLSAEEREGLEAYRCRVNGHTLKMMIKIRNPKSGWENPDFDKDLFSRFPLKKEDKQALTYLSLMPVQGIPGRLFLEISQISEDSLDRLGEYLLVQKRYSEHWKDEMLFLHPVISEAARNVFDPSPINCSRLIKGMEQYLNGTSGAHNNTWGRTYEENQSLEVYIFAFLKAFPKPVAWLATAFDEFCTFLWIQEYFQEAEEYSLLLYACTESYYGAVHQMTGQMALRTAAVFYNEMKFSEAEEWYKKALKILEASKPGNELYWYLRTSANVKVSRMYRHGGKWEKSLELIREALLCNREYIGAMPPGADHPQQILGFILLEESKIRLGMKELSEAESLCRKGLSIVIETMPDRSGFLMNEFWSLLVDILVEKGEYREAEPMAKRVLEESELFRGESFKNTLICREKLGDIYMGQGKLREAQTEYNEVLKKLSRRYPYEDQWRDRICGKII